MRQKSTVQKNAFPLVENDNPMINCYLQDKKRKFRGDLTYTHSFAENVKFC